MHASYWPYSTLPGETIPALHALDEPGRVGGRRGLSRTTVVFCKEGPVELEIAHYATPINNNWRMADEQRLWIWLRRIGENKPVASAQFSHPIDKETDQHHDLVWIADNVVCDSDHRRFGVASALYAHAWLFGYKLARSAEPMGANPKEKHSGGDGLWKRLHPNYEVDEFEELLPCVRFLRTEHMLTALTNRFGPTAMGTAFEVAELQHTDWGLPGYSAGLILKAN